MEDRNRVVVTEYIPSKTVFLDPKNKSKSIVSPGQATRRSFPIMLTIRSLAGSNVFGRQGRCLHI